jgi:hypothetical protein
MAVNTPNKQTTANVNEVFPMILLLVSAVSTKGWGIKMAAGAVVFAEIRQRLSISALAFPIVRQLFSNVRAAKQVIAHVSCHR